MIHPAVLFAVFWIGFALSWLIAARWKSKAARTLAGPGVWLYRALLLAGALLMQVVVSRRLHAPQLWPISYASATTLALLTLPGFAFAWWARLHLGRLWSSAVTRKADHRLIDNGPYAIVRHPIYTGIGFACLVSAAVVATPVSVVGFALLTAGFWLKARLEEGLLAEELGAGTYAAYRARVPMLIPFWPTARR